MSGLPFRSGPPGQPYCQTAAAGAIPGAVGQRGADEAGTRRRRVIAALAQGLRRRFPARR